MSAGDAGGSPASPEAPVSVPALEGTGTGTGRAASPSWIFFVFVGFLLGNGTGFFAAVVFFGPRSGASHDAPGGLDSEPTSERPADVAHPLHHEGKGFVVSYPANWRAGSASEGDSPLKVSLESPGASSVEIAVREAASDVTEELALKLATYGDNMVQDGVRGDFAIWGRYSGRGVELRGKLLGDVPGGVRVFAASMGQRSFTVVELFHDEDLQSVKPGLELVERTFELR